MSAKSKRSAPAPGLTFTPGEGLRLEAFGRLGPKLQVVTVNNRDVEVRREEGPPFVWIPRDVLSRGRQPGVVVVADSFLRQAKSKPAHRAVLGI